MSLIAALLDAISAGLADLYIALVSLAGASLLGLVVYGIALIGAPRQ